MLLEKAGQPMAGRASQSNGTESNMFQWNILDSVPLPCEDVVAHTCRRVTLIVERLVFHMAKKCILFHKHFQHDLQDSQTYMCLR